MWKEALDLLNREKFDAVIVGHRFSSEEKYLLAVEAEEKVEHAGGVSVRCGSRFRDSCDQSGLCAGGQHRSSVSSGSIVSR